MSALPEIAGDWHLRGLDADQVYARFQLSDDALTAAVWATAKFHHTFPGWQLYRRITAGMTLFDDELDAWVVGGAALLARARKRNGRCYVEARGPWVAQAARDALAVVIRQPAIDSASVAARGREFGVHYGVWLKIYKPILAMLIIGLETFRCELHSQYRIVKTRTPDSGGNLVWEGANFARHIDPQSGNSCRRHAPNPDNLHAPAMPDVLK